MMTQHGHKMQMQRKLSTKMQLKQEVICFAYQTKAMGRLINFKVQVQAVNL